MLSAEDRKWLNERFSAQDKRFEEQDKRFEKMQRETRVQFESVLDAMDKHAQKLGKESDARFAEMMKSMDNRFQKQEELIDRKFQEQERHFEVIVENKISARLDAFVEYLPGAYKSYERLEDRVDRIEMKQDVLENMVMDHIQNS